MNDDDFVALINESVPLWLKEFKEEVTDKRLLWDVVGCWMLWDVVGCCGMLWDVVGCCGMLLLWLLLYRIRRITIKYSKEKAPEKRRKISDIEASLKISKEVCAQITNS